MRIVCALLLFSSCAAAQNAQKVISEYLRAMGGPKALAQVRSETIAGSLTEEGSGRTGSFSIILKAPNRFYLEVLVGSGRTVDAYNGMSAWRQDSAEGARTVTGAGAREAEAAGRYWNSRLADLKKAKIGVQLAGQEKVRGHDAWHLQVRLGPGLTRDIFVDAESHLVVRETASTEQFDYDEYRAVNGIAAPYRIELRRGGHTYVVTVTRVEFNGTVEDSVFDFPRANGSPVPEIKTLIMEVQRNQHAVEEVQREYTCHATEEEEKVDSKSHISSCSGSVES